MKVERKITWTTKDGKNAELTISIERTVKDDIAWADGYNINLGRKTEERKDSLLLIDGEKRDSAYWLPYEIIPSPRNANVRAAGAVAQINSVYLGQEQYNMVLATISEIEAEFAAAGDAEYAEVKAAETTRELDAARAEKEREEAHRKELANGLCPKCGTYCYGDCSAE